MTGDVPALALSIAPLSLCLLSTWPARFGAPAALLPALSLHVTEHYATIQDYDIHALGVRSQWCATI